MTEKYAKDVLVGSLGRRLKHLMVKTLDDFDRYFPTNADSEVGGMFKFNLRNAFNDAIRANRDELNDYDLTYKPLKVAVDGTLSVTKAFAEAMESIVFSTDPVSVSISSDKKNAAILESIKAEFGVGLAYLENDRAIFMVSGVPDCVKITAFFDRYRLTASIRKEYVAWRTNLVHLYHRS
jgi:hypothetical protein